MMQTSHEIHEIADALAKAQAELENVEKGGTNPHFRSKYATLPDVLAEVRPKFAKQGISIIQMPVNGKESDIGVITRLAHSSGQWIQSELYVAPSKFDAQGAGSVVTYLRRYALMAMAGVSADDDDGNAAVTRPSPEPPRSIPRMPSGAEKTYQQQMPHLIQFPQLQSGGPDYRRFGSALMTALRAEKAQQPWREWQIANADQLDRMKEKEPAQYDKLIQAIDRDGDRFRDMVAAEEAASVIS